MERINEQKDGRETGHWESVKIVKNNQAEPIECAFPANKQNFISDYADGTLLIRSFSNKGEKEENHNAPRNYCGHISLAGYSLQCGTKANT